MRSLLSILCLVAVVLVNVQLAQGFPKGKPNDTFNIYVTILFDLRGTLRWFQLLSKQEANIIVLYLPLDVVMSHKHVYDLLNCLFISIWHAYVSRI